MAVAEGAEPISLKEEEKPVSSPLRDAWKLFRRNRASVAALVMLIVILSVAITAHLWTEIGLLDVRGCSGAPYDQSC
jgi:hypothetical protein